jgi:hypothetical protein
MAAMARFIDFPLQGAAAKPIGTTTPAVFTIP